MAKTPPTELDARAWMVRAVHGTIEDWSTDKRNTLAVQNPISDFEGLSCKTIQHGPWAYVTLPLGAVPELVQVEGAALPSFVMRYRIDYNGTLLFYVEFDFVRNSVYCE